MALPGLAAYLAAAGSAMSLSRDLYPRLEAPPARESSFDIPGMAEKVWERGQSFRPFRQPTFRETNAVFQDIKMAGESYQVRYGFRNFNRDALEIQVRMPRREVSAAEEEYGYKTRDFQELDAWYQRAQKQVIDRVQGQYITGRVNASSSAELERKMAQVKAHNAGLEAGLNRSLQDLAQEYRSRRAQVYARSGFKYKDSKTVEANIPEMSRRNARRLTPASLAFAELVQEREYGMEELVGAVTAMVQTSMRYEIPPTSSGDKVIAGVLPPPKSFVMGQGDCDTKSALIGSILLNWPNLKLVGLSIPQHYLIAVHRIPARGDVYIEHQGIPYVMIESAGPAWIPPGKVGEFTQEYLGSGRLFTIQPL